MKKLTILFLIWIYTFPLYSCSTSLNKYVIYICETQANKTDTIETDYIIGGETYTLPKSKVKTKSNQEDKSYEFYGRELTLKYESTYNKEYTPYNVDSYRDVGNSVRVCFKENTNQLESINAESLEI